MARKMHDRTACRWHYECHKESRQGALIRGKDGSQHRSVTEGHPAPGKTFPQARRIGRQKGREELVVRKYSRVEGQSTEVPVVADRAWREAEMYLWLKKACEDGWEARRCSSEELKSVLYGPCSGAWG